MREVIHTRTEYGHITVVYVFGDKTRENKCNHVVQQAGLLGEKRIKMV